MPRLFWPNFDFEHELAAGKNWQPTAKLQTLNARYAAVLLALCDDDDLIVLPAHHPELTASSGKIHFIDEKSVREADEFLSADWELVPWGVTDSLQTLADHRGWKWDQPKCDLVKRLNDRLGSFAWEQASDTLPIGAAVIESEEALFEELKYLPTSRWIIKAFFGMSARERIVGSTEKLSDSQRGWIRKRLREQRLVFLEPWLDIEAEVGLQFDIPNAGDVKFLAALPIINSETGEYRGSRLSLTEEERDLWRPAIDFGLQFAEQIQELGYFGPLGIDACQYRSGGELIIRPMMDINARWTMGRIAFEWTQKSGTTSENEWLLADVLA